MPKFTPGPWVCEEKWNFPDEQGRVFPSVCKKEGQDTVLICSFEHSVYRENALDNAQAIASLPSLYAAARDAFEALAETYKDTPADEKPIMLEQLASALTLADGEERNL